MPLNDDVAAWLRYYDRRAQDGFGTCGGMLEKRRQSVLAYIAQQSPAAWLALTQTHPA